MVRSPVLEPSSFIRAARRGQLVECAIDVLVESGYAQASLVAIAKRAGVSRGVITYHFADRDELMAEVVRDAYAKGLDQVGPPVKGAASPRLALLAFIGASVEFYAAYPRHVVAMTEILTTARRERTTPSPTRDLEAGEQDGLEAILWAGQRAGQFRAFVVPLMATAVRQALKGAAQHVVHGGDVNECRTELETLFDLATGMAS